MACPAPTPTQEPTVKSKAATAAPKATATREIALEDLAPDELGLEIGTLYLEAIQAVTELVKDRPPVAEVEAQVAALKESYVQRLVPLGHRREALGRQDLAAVNNAINDTFIAGTKSDWYNTYFEAVQYYGKVDEEFEQLLYSFNLIGNYARFEMLREQDPDEAMRLGLMETSAVEAPTPAPESAPGEAMRNEPGGYSFQPIADFVVQETGGRVVMNADGGDPEYGPAVIILGGPNAEHASVEELFDSLLAEADASQLSNRRDITVDGVPGIAVDVKSQRNGSVEVSSRIVVALRNANQQFTMFGFAPTEQWNELEPLFEGVLASIRLFEPLAAPASAPASALATGLGEERRSEYGGFVFRPIEGYGVSEDPGMIGVFAPDGDVDVGPGILILSLFDEEVVGLEPLVDALTADAPGMQVSEQRQVTVGGVAGVAVDLSGADDQGRMIASRIVVVLLEPTRQFTMIGIAPPERWNGELEPLFEEMLASISFFEPTAGATGE
jgi:hypothetical protein